MQKSVEETSLPLNIQKLSRKSSVTNGKSTVLFSKTDSAYQLKGPKTNFNDITSGS